MKLELTADDLALIHLALTKYPLPFDQVGPLIQRIGLQIKGQTNGDLPPLPEGADYIRHQGGMPQ
jgi:hypothetical protein